MQLTTILRWLLCLAIGLPMLVLVLQLGGALLAIMGDEAGPRVLRGIAIGSGILWVVALLGILVLVAIDVLSRTRPPE